MFGGLASAWLTSSSVVSLRISPLCRRVRSSVSIDGRGRVRAVAEDDVGSSSVDMVVDVFLKSDICVGCDPSHAPKQKPSPWE